MVADWAIGSLHGRRPRQHRAGSGAAVSSTRPTWKRGQGPFNGRMPPGRTLRSSTWRLLSFALAHAITAVALFVAHLVKQNIGRSSFSYEPIYAI